MRLLRHTIKIYLKVFLKAIKWHSHNTKACSHFGFSSCRGSLYVSQWEQTYTLLLTQWSRCDSKAPQRRKQTENRGPKGSGGEKSNESRNCCIHSSFFRYICHQWAQWVQHNQSCSVFVCFSLWNLKTLDIWVQVFLFFVQKLSK